ncbi:dienelactone hydrolase family protein [Dyella sp. ASV21]|jgi:predicted dienelactone hydrolase|uniref:alpha/beta hydrolase family protein n=1 Tax=Dyella sp. ASV21 TaxID=2795114 RepID=UPI0018EC82DF|nr:dienelactone hydrolase family protein [Dyella sp. ASV21]
MSTASSPTTLRRPRLLAGLGAALWLLLASMAFGAPTVSGVGIAPIRITDPVSGGQTDGFVFYPSSEPTPGVTTLGPYEVAAKLNAPPAPGPKPLVVISHGNGGSRLGHHDLASFLASHGFVVATLNHPKDDFEDTSGVGHIEVLAGRPVQVKATISMLLADPHWKTLIDPARIGVAGFSAGGYTSLMVAGAKPQFTRFVDFCEHYPKDDNVCGKLADFQVEAKQAGLSLRQLMQQRQDQLYRYGDTADPRVKAAFAMAPLSLIFDAHSFDSVTVPIYLYYGANDHVLRPEANARHIQPLIHTLAGVKEVPNADHWVFLAPCSPALAKQIPELCTDPAGVDRRQVHAQINADALAFFRRTLHVSGD